ncbi:MAG: hypothetical protein WC670_17530 [Pseudolabrys sp.]|jgi:hypothetical protein
MLKLLPLFIALIATPAYADCFCKGCGCKGGPGWRGPGGNCVSHKALSKTCGSPPGAPCAYEGAQQVCDSSRAPLVLPSPGDKK